MGAITEGGPIIIRTFKVATGNPSYEWGNTYEAHLEGGAEAEAFVTALQAILTAEAAVHVDAVRFTRATASTWVADSTPYDPESFIVVDAPADLTGALDLAEGEYLPRNICLNVRRSVPTGRSGRVLYRGVLGENDITNDSSLFPSLDADAITPLNTRFATLYGEINDALEVLGGVGSEMRLISLGFGGLGTYQRRVTAFVPRSVTVVSPDHKYFDRA